MGWKKVPGVEGWEVAEEESPEGRRLFKYTEDENRAGQRWASLWNLRSRLNDFFDLDLRDNDPRIQMENSRLKIRVPVKERDFKLFCTPIDASVFKAIKDGWEREKWRELEEHKLMEKCLDELYDLGKLTPQTSAGLAEYEGFLELRYPELMRQPRGRLDLFIVLAHKKFVNSGLNTSLTPEKLRSLQLGLGLKPTGRYDFATAKAVKALQIKLRGKGLYKAAADGLWNSKFEAAWQAYKESRGKGRVIIEDFGEDAYDPRTTILMPSLVKSLRTPDSLWIGHDELLKAGKTKDLVIRIGFTFKNCKLVPVFILKGGKFMEEIAAKIRTATRLREDEKEYTNTIKELAKELEERGLTKENLEQMAKDAWELWDTLDWFLLFYGGIKKIGTEGVERLIKEFGEEVVEETAERKVKKKAAKETIEEAVEKGDWDRAGKEIKRYTDEVIEAKGRRLTPREQKLLLRDLAELTPKDLQEIGHHLFPSALKKDFAEKVGINVNKKGFLEYIGKEFHKVCHAKGTKRPSDWVEWWRDWFKKFPKKKPERKDIVKGLRQCLKKFEFTNVDEIVRRVRAILLP